MNPIDEESGDQLTRLRSLLLHVRPLGKRKPSSLQIDLHLILCIALGGTTVAEGSGIVAFPGFTPDIHINSPHLPGENVLE